jgi:anti-sigma regulatory factor (Ser/Thr protein kinase)
MIDDARVVVTELVSNVVRHAGTDLALIVDLDPVRDRVRIDVVDHADGEVVLRGSTSADLGGRGLRLVDELSDGWGVERQQHGK